jgi:hypothetical protein
MRKGMKMKFQSNPRSETDKTVEHVRLEPCVAMKRAMLRTYGEGTANGIPSMEGIFRPAASAHRLRAESEVPADRGREPESSEKLKGRCRLLHPPILPQAISRR